MIIGYKYKYLFIELPRSACTAIGNELVNQYGGERILWKHARYDDFIRSTGHAPNDYFVFSSIRNPFDEVVSFYYKLKFNHRGNFTNPECFVENGGHVTPNQRREYDFVQQGRSFEEYLGRFRKLPYVNWSVLDHKKLDFVIRYEALQRDFSTVLQMLGVEQVRPLPMVNRTQGVNRQGQVLFPSGSTRHAVRVFGPMLEYWGYQFPFDVQSEWPSRTDLILFRLMKIAKSIYWRRFSHLRRRGVRAAPPHGSGDRLRT
jgi:Sulfotransferase family